MGHGARTGTQTNSILNNLANYISGGVKKGETNATLNTIGKLFAGNFATGSDMKANDTKLTLITDAGGCKVYRHLTVTSSELTVNGQLLDDSIVHCRDYMDGQKPAKVKQALVGRFQPEEDKKNYITSKADIIVINKETGAQRLESIDTIML